MAARFRPATTKLRAEPKEPWMLLLPGYRRSRNPVPQRRRVVGQPEFPLLDPKQSLVARAPR
jgi:hypothetical protein